MSEPKMMSQEEAAVFAVVYNSTHAMLEASHESFNIQPALQGIGTAMVQFFLMSSTDAETAVDAFKKNLDLTLAIHQKSIINKMEQKNHGN